MPVRRRMMVIGRAAAVVVVLATLVALRPGDGPFRPACGEPTPDDAGAPLSLVDDGSGLTSLAMDWTSDPPLLDDLVFNDVSVSEDVAIAVGREELAGRRQPPLTLMSSDGGRTWDRAALQGPLLDGDLASAAHGPAGWVAVGSMSTDDRGGSAGLTYWSADGRSWQGGAQPAVPYIAEVVAGDGRYVALGAGGRDGQLIGLSEDGRTWRWHEPRVGAGYVMALAWVDGEWVAAGVRPRNPGQGLPTVWRSLDLTRWTCATLPAPRDTSFGYVDRVLPGAGTTLLVGTVAPPCSPFASCAGLTASWTPTPAGSWSISDRFTARPGPHAIAPDGSFVAVDGEGTWRSVDGVRWERVANVPSGGFPAAIAVGPDGVIGVGAAFGTGRAVGWIGLLDASE